MKARTVLILVVIGLWIEVAGVLFKVQHWPGAGIIFIGSSAPTFIGLAVLGWKALRYPGLKDFLDS